MMIDISQIQHEIAQQNQKIKELNQAVGGNGEEIKSLEQALAESKGRYDETKTRIQKANAELAMGVMTSDQFVNLKSELKEQESAFTNLQGALKAQKNAREFLFSERGKEAENLKVMKREIAVQISEELFDRIIGDEALQQLICAFFARQEPARFSRKQDQESLFQFLGLELCNKVFWDPEQERALIPDILEARTKFDEFVFNP